MSNKKIFKEIYSSKINKEQNYYKILKKIENQNQKNFSWKKTLIPVTGILLIIILIYINTDKKNNTFEDTINNKDYNTYTSNTESQKNSFTNDIVIKKIEVEEKEIKKIYSYLKKIIIPTDLKEKEYKGIYLKENNKNKISILNNYEIKYQNKENSRTIILSFSDKYIQLREYYFNDVEKKYNINNNEIIIYQNKHKYLTIFNYNNINFDIETNNINEEELLNLIKSIME